jgi:putative component of toxin-antitoxin plasmid stabilization module
MPGYTISARMANDGIKAQIDRTKPIFLATSPFASHCGHILSRLAQARAKVARVITRMEQGNLGKVKSVGEGYWNTRSISARDTGLFRARRGDIAYLADGRISRSIDARLAVASALRRSKLIAPDFDRLARMPWPMAC